MDKLAESKVREIVGEGKLYQVTTFNGKLSTIETGKRELELIRSWDEYCSNRIIDVSGIKEGSRIINEIKEIFGDDAKVLAYSRAGSDYDCHKDEYILWQSTPDRYGHISVDTDLTVDYLVCIKSKKKPSLPDNVEKDGSAIYFNWD